MTKGEMELDSIIGNPPFEAKREEKRKGLVGIVSNGRGILAFNYSASMDICVSANKVEDGEWRVEVRSGGEVRFEGVLHGGANLARTFCKFLRNGMTSKRQKRKALRNIEREEGEVKGKTLSPPPGGGAHSRCAASCPCALGGGRRRRLRRRLRRQRL